MGVIDLHLTEYRMRNQHASCCLSNKPVSRDNINWRAIDRIWMDGGGDDWEAGEYYETSADSAATLTGHGLA